MNTAIMRVAMLLLVVLVALGLLLGCSVPTDPEPEVIQNPEDIVNPDKPNSNARIVADKTIGDAGKWSTVWELTTDRSGGHYFRGGHNSYLGAGRLNASGDVAWFFRTSYTPMGVCAGPSGGVDPLVVAGKQDVDDDGESEIGFVSSITPGGSLLSQLTYSADTSDVWLNTIVHVADSTFLVAGGVRAPDVKHPFIATIVLTSAGQLEKKRQAIINTLPGRAFAGIAVDPSVPTETAWSFYVTSGMTDANAAIHKVSIVLPELAPWTVDWSLEVSVPSAQKTSVSDLRFFGGNLYVSGDIQDPDKTPLPSDGGYWRSGIAASVTSTGALRWIKAVGVTQHTDRFYGVVASADGVYAVGECAMFVLRGQYFGYGWISKLSESTGGVVSNWTFGGDKYSSGFSRGNFDGSMIHCGGWTHQEIGGVYNAWFCTVDTKMTLSEAPAILPALIHDNDRAIPEDRRAGVRDDG